MLPDHTTIWGHICAKAIEGTFCSFALLTLYVGEGDFKVQGSAERDALQHDEGVINLQPS